jgi:hypothetical protein
MYEISGSEPETSVSAYPIFSGFRSKKYSATEYKVGRMGVNSFENLEKAWMRKAALHSKQALRL